MNETNFVVMDGSSMLVRAFFATTYPGRPVRSTNGIYTNAVLGFLNMMFSALHQFRPSHLFVAWDVSRDTFRRTLYPAYKGTRGELPDELLTQFDTMQEVLAALGVAQSLHPDYEADDIIGTLAMQAKVEGMDVLILTGDRDALQLVRPNITVAIMKKGMTELAFYTPESLYDTYGLTAEQMIDVKSLMGDTSDNIPGIPGIGEKTALKLVQQHESLENILDNLHQFGGKLRERLETHRDLAVLSKKLATICLDVPVPHTVDSCRLSFQRELGAQKLQALNLGRTIELLEKYAEAR